MNKYLCTASLLTILFAGIANAHAAECSGEAITCIKKDYSKWLIDTNHDPESYQLGAAIVKEDRGSARFPLALSSAYIQALLHAQAEIAKTEYLRQVVKIYEQHEKDGLEEPEAQVSELEAKVESMKNKVMALAEAEIDSKLSEFGVDPQTYSVCSNEQKKLKFLDLIQSKAVERASASVSGYLPVQTFVACDEDGGCAMGVAISSKEQTLRLIHNITHAGSTYQPESGRKDMYSEFKEKIKNDADFSNDFGVRMMYDAEGYPVFISFGQAAVSKDGGKIMHQHMVESASRKARQMADSYLSMLFNQSVNYEQEYDISGETSIKSKKGLDASCNATGFSVDEAAQKVEDKLNSQTGTISHSGISGIKPIYSWSKEDGQYETIGEIVVWSPKTAQRSENLRNMKHALAKGDSSALQAKDAGEQVKQEGFLNRGIDTDAYDF